MRLLLTMIVALLLVASAARAQELVPATAEEQKAIAAAIVDGAIALAEYDAPGIAGTADLSLQAEMEQVRDLALTLPAERFLPPFDGEACAPLWASLRILELRRDYSQMVLEAMTGEDLLNLLIVDSRGPSAYTWQRMLNDSGSAGWREKLQADPVAALKMFGIKALYVDGERAYGAIDGYEPAVVSVAMQHAHGSWRPDYRFHLEFWREIEITIAYAYALNKGEIEPAMLTPAQFLAGLSLFLSHEPVPPEELERLSQPLAAGGEFKCLPSINSAPLVLCLDGSATCG